MVRAFTIWHFHNNATLYKDMEKSDSTKPLLHIDLLWANSLKYKAEDSGTEPQI